MEKVRLGGLSALALENSQFASPLVYHRHSLGGGTISRSPGPGTGLFKRVGGSCTVVAGIRGGKRSGKKNNIAAGATATISRSTVVFPADEVIDFDQRAADLEKMFNETVSGTEAIFTVPSLEKLVADLESQPRLDFDSQCTGEPSSSHTVPALAGKRRAKQEKAAQAGMEVTQSAAAQADGSVPALADVKKGSRKRRLDLTTRIAIRKGKEDIVGSLSVVQGRHRRKDNVVTRDVKVLKEVTYDITDMWSEQAEDLVTRYGTALDLGSSWNNLDRGILTGIEETSLALLMKPMKTLQRLRRTLNETVRRDATEEELAVAAKMDLASFRRQMALGRAARNKLIQHNLRLVLFQAHKYHRDKMNLSLFDLCQEGVQGLLQGVDKFDPERGHRFSTYAVYWIRNSILRAQTRSGHLLRSPFNLAGHKLNIKRARLELLLKLERPASDEEVAAKLGLKQDRFRDIVRSTLYTRSLYERSRVTGEEHVQNFADCENLETKLLRLSGDALLRLGMDDVLDSLKPKESIVLRQRFGLDGKGERSLGEIGRNLNLSREMVRRYEARGLLKLKHPTRLDYLRSYLSE
uniref:Sigma factor 5 n=1 Tax=Anthoceros angustus TaxID=48387 RepID=A0A6G6D2Y1_ANTAG|nr:sigma factor 5 [Anthoceros angustus]